MYFVTNIITRGQAQLSRVIHAGGTHMWTHRAPRYPDHSLDWFSPVRCKVQCPWPPTAEAGPLSVCVTCTRRDPSATTPDILRWIPNPLPLRRNSTSLTEETHTLPYHHHLFSISKHVKSVSQYKLDGHGRARREAARRRKSEWKVNLDIRNSSRGSASKRLQKLYLRTTWRMDVRQLTVYEHMGVSIYVPIRFSFVDQSSPRRLENFGEDIPTSPTLSRLTHLILSQILNFRD